MNRFLLLATTLFAPVFIFAMEPTEYKAPEGLVTHREKIRTLHLATYLMLTDFHPKTEKSTKELANVLTQMNNLRLSRPPVEPQEVGFFILKKNPPISFVESFITPFSFTPHPETISIFFKRIADYNTIIGKQALVAPNESEACNYLKAQKIAGVIEKNAHCGIIISQQIINENTVPTPESVDVVAFAQLAQDIAKILKYTDKERRWSTRLIYHHELNGKIGAV